jgi:hypothetical protein
MSSSREVDPGVPIPRVPRLSCPVLCDWTHKKPGWTQKKAAPSSWRLRQRLGTATLVTSNLLLLAASNVLLPGSLIWCSNLWTLFSFSPSSSNDFSFSAKTHV